MCLNVFLNFGFIIGLLSLTPTDSFLLLQNAPATLTNLATSASAYASGPQEPRTHIANLRNKQQKTEQLQSEKLLVEDDPYSELSTETGNENENEAAPSLFQKKLEKILTKIRFISSLAGGSASGNGGGDDTNNNNASVENTGNNINVTTTIEKDPLDQHPDDDIDNEISNKTTEETTSERQQTFQKVIYPHSNYGAPLKVSFDLNERIVNRPQAEDVREQSQNIQTVEDMGKLGQIGVFFAEVLGSIVGLVYGAAAQISSGSLGDRSV